jgi:hypothetical protein
VSAIGAVGPSRNPILPGGTGFTTGGVVEFVVFLLIWWLALSLLVGWLRARQSGRPLISALRVPALILGMVVLAVMVVATPVRVARTSGTIVSRQGIPPQPASLPQWGQRYPIYDPNTPDHLEHNPDGSVKLSPPLGSETPPFPPPRVCQLKPVEPVQRGTGGPARPMPAGC